jgi:hypothetical protein
VLLTNLISIPARYDTSHASAPGLSFTIFLNFKDSACSTQAPDPPGLGRHSKVSNYREED